MATVLGILVKGAGFGRIDRIVFAGAGFSRGYARKPWVKKGILDESKTDWQRNGGNGMIRIRLSQDFFLPLPTSFIHWF
jgi:hypothetical protein